MPLPARDGVIYRFGAFELASGSGELRKNGLRLKLQDQPIRLLILLLENAGEVVTRDEIQKRLWADDVHVDYENAINSAVRKLREVLVDTSENPRYVETLAKRGYRFIAPVSTTAATSSPPVQLPLEIPVARKRSWLLPISALLAIAAISGMAFWFWSSRVGVAPPLTAVPLTSYPGYEVEPSFSPDGNQVAFAWDDGGGVKYNLYVQLIGSGRPLRLTTGTANDVFPAWSPDGRSIAFMRAEAEGNTSLRLVPALGGPEREVARLGKGAFRYIGGWSPDGRQLFISWADKANEPSKLFRVSVDTGEKHGLTSPPPATPGDEWCRISPDGQTIAFVRMRSLGVGGPIGDLYILPLSPGFVPNGQPKRLTFDNRELGAMAWTANNREIVFSSKRGGSMALWRIPVSGREKPTRLEVGENALFPAISPRANRLVYGQQVAFDTNIWRMDLTQPSLHPISLIASTRQDGSAQYSPDARRIVFHSDRSGSNEIWVCDADGSDSVQLTTRGQSGSPHWSPDGGRIAFDSVVDGVYQIFEISSQGGQPRQLTSGSLNIRPSWSHDGKWIYFGSTRTGRYEVWKVPALGGTAVQLSRNGGNNPLESEDGTTIYYNSGNSIMKAATVGRGETRILDGVQDVVGNMSLTSDGIYYRDTQRPTTVQFFSFLSGKSRLILKTEKPSGQVGVSPDGHWLLYMQYDSQPGSDLMLVENFH